MSTVLRAADLLVRLEIGETTIDVSFDSDQFDLERAALLDWVMQSARAATAYFGRFPVTHAQVRILLSQAWAHLERDKLRRAWGAMPDLGRSTCHTGRSQR